MGIDPSAWPAKGRTVRRSDQTPGWTIDLIATLAGFLDPAHCLKR